MGEMTDCTATGSRIFASNSQKESAREVNAENARRPVKNNGVTDRWLNPSREQIPPPFLSITALYPFTSNTQRQNFY